MYSGVKVNEKHDGSNEKIRSIGCPLINPLNFAADILLVVYNILAKYPAMPGNLPLLSVTGK